MPYQQAVFANKEFYHVFNRGVEKRTIFTNRRDYRRFLQTLDYYRLKNPPTRFSFRNRPTILRSQRASSSPLIEIVCFCLMPTHFHLLLRQLEESGITTFISKLTNSYTKYFNTKYRRIGPLLQGSFKAVRIENDEQLVHVSRYIHLNPVIDYLVRDLRRYEYSSYLEYVAQRHGFCRTDYVLSHFSSVNDYEKFVLDQEDYGRVIKNIERLLLDTE